MPRRPARSQKLPLSEVNLLNSLDYDHRVLRCQQLFKEGWTLSSIGNAFTPPKGRSSIKAWIDRPETQGVHVDVPIPNPQYATPKNGYQRKTPPSPGVTTDVARKLALLAPKARLYRSRQPANHPYAKANREMDQLVKDLYDHHVSIADIARAAQVTHRAIAKRLNKLTDTES